MTPDVNVLVAAFRDDHSHHVVARAWLEDAVASCELGVSLKIIPMVGASFLRLVTNSRIFVEPALVGDAIGFLDALLSVPGIDMPSLGGEWPIFRELCTSKGLTANALPDAWLAAAVIQFNEHLVTFDADFKTLLRPMQLTILRLA